MGTDFELYSSKEDALAGRNPWKYCNYDDPGVGFPRDCGKTGGVGGQWNSMTRGGRGNIKFTAIAAGGTLFVWLPVLGQLRLLDTLRDGDQERIFCVQNRALWNSYKKFRNRVYRSKPNLVAGRRCRVGIFVAGS